jgi:hypothetical protein
MDQSKEKRILILDNLFQMIDVKKKGISLVYDYLLEHEIIEDLNAVQEALGLTLKRVYKICAELKDLNLCQTIDRPMKISLLDPQIAWERAVNNKIQLLRDELNEKIGATEKSLDEFFKTYNIQKVQRSPVEFIRYDGFEFVLYALWANQSVQIASGIKYTNPGLKQILEDYLENRIPDHMVDHFKSAFQNLEIKVLLSEESLRDSIPDVELYRQVEFQLAQDMREFSPKLIEVRVTQEPFSNFTIRDNEILLQPSFDPNNRILGSFATSQKEIVQIFQDKFNVLFENATPIEDVLPAIPELSDKEFPSRASFAFASI